MKVWSMSLEEWSGNTCGIDTGGGGGLHVTKHICISLVGGLWNQR